MTMRPRFRRSFRLAAILLSGTALTAVPLAALAADWTGATSSDWYDGANWSTAAAPDSTTSVLINTTSPNAAIINGNMAAAGLVAIGQSASGSLTITNAATLDTSDNIVLGGAGGFGTLSVEGLSFLNLAAGKELDVGGAGTGILTIDHSTVTDDIAHIGSTGGLASVTVQNDGIWHSADLNVGSQSSSPATLIVQGSSSVFSSTGEVGVGGNGAVSITDNSAWETTGLVVGDGGTGSVTVEDGGFLAAAGLTVGGSLSSSPTTGTDTLAISSGGHANVGNTDIGEYAGYTGTVTVDGAGSSFNGTTGTMTVGDTGGSGSITATNSAAVSALDIVLAHGENSTGTLTLDASSLTVTNNLDIGDGGAGTLLARNGSTVIGDFLILGTSTDGVGVATFTGSTTTGVFSGGADIGNNSGASLSVTQGAQLATGSTRIGDSGNGTALVDGQNSTLASTNDLTLGFDVGTGALTVSGGGTVVAGDTYIGYQSAGTVTVTDQDSALTIGGALDLGDTASGSLSVLNGGLVAVGGNIFIGRLLGGSGTVTVDGTNSQLLGNNGTLYVGGNDLGVDGGDGTVNITNGGVVTAGEIALGASAGRTGTVTVDGTDSYFASADTLVVGAAGTGTLIARNKAAIAADEVVLGSMAGSSGTFTASDSGTGVTISDELTVGNNGTGVLSVLNGASVADFSAEVGANDGTGTVTVDGAGSVWATRTVLSLGEGSTGTLTISNGGAATAGETYIGAPANVTGTATVTGAGSSFTGASDLYIGYLGTGSFAVQNGGVATFGGETYLGDEAGSTGSLTVDGAGSQFTSAFNILVGGDGLDPTGGNGAITVTNGGALSTPYSIYTATAQGDTGDLTVDGAGSKVSATEIGVAYVGTSNVMVSNGGAVTATIVDVAGLPGSVGTVTVTGANSSFIAGTAAIGDFGTATLTVSNSGMMSTADSYLGYEAISPYAGVGTATIDGAGSSWTSTSLDVGYHGTGRLIVSNGGEAVTPILTVATNAGSTGEIDIGAAPGDAPTAPGAIVTPVIQFGAGAGTLNFNHTSEGMTFNSLLAGAGTINQLAGVTFLPGDSSAFTGPTNITGGALHVNGSLANSAIAVSGGGTLAGNGTVGAVSAASGGIVAPGNSIGTLTVNGDYSAASGSVYQAQLDSTGHSDLLNVTGTAGIANGAILNISKIDTGGYVNGTQYKLLTAAGGVSGSYTVTGDVAQSAFLAETVSYDAHDVYLNVAKVASFASAGGTPNQKATGGAADSLPTGGPLYAALSNLPTFAAAQGAFDQLSGEVHASARTALVEDSRFVREAALDRLQAANPLRPVVWGQGFGDWGSNDGNGNAAGMNHSTKGFIGGADVPVYQTWRVGVLGGFSDTDLNAKDRNSAGTGTNYHLGLYGGTETGPVAVRLGAAYSWHDLQTLRAVAFTSLSNKLTAEYNGGTTQAFGEIGYKIDANAVSLEPFANLAYVNLNMGAFKEVGGAAALSVAGNTTSTTFTTLGLHAREKMDLGIGADVTAKASLGWRHAFGDLTPVASNTFAGSTSFAIDGVPVAQDAAAIDAGFDAQVTNYLTFSLSYTGQYASSAHDNGVKASVNLAF